MSETVEQGSVPAPGDRGRRADPAAADPRYGQDVAAAFVSITNALAADHALDEVHVALTEACVRILDVASARPMIPSIART